METLGDTSLARLWVQKMLDSNLMSKEKIRPEKIWVETKICGPLGLKNLVYKKFGPKKF